MAQRAAFALYRDDRPAAWRRLIAIAFEDIGPADLDVIMETVAIATLPKWRAVIGEEARLFVQLSPPWPQHPRTAVPII